jgi:hypothetical protein
VRERAQYELPRQVGALYIIRVAADYGSGFDEPGLDGR